MYYTTPIIHHFIVLLMTLVLFFGSTEKPLRCRQGPLAHLRHPLPLQWQWKDSHSQPFHFCLMPASPLCSLQCCFGEWTQAAETHDSNCFPMGLGWAARDRFSTSTSVAECGSTAITCLWMCWKKMPIGRILTITDEKINTFAIFGKFFSSGAKILLFFMPTKSMKSSW